MKRIFLGLLFIVNCSLFIALPVKAVVDPWGVPNNRVGVHILEPGEIEQASKLVNSNGGDWGYVTVPLRSNDRDYEKWLSFFNKSRELHVIPIIRLATYPVNEAWETPTVFDLVDFANFLNDMPWPTKNRYVVIFNEPNHANEWGGAINPFEYATLLEDAKNIFKTRSTDFFLLTGGLDMSVPNSKTSMEALRFYQQMTSVKPNWYDAIDGLSVHAYPNPGFSASVYSTTRYGITSYRYELSELGRLGFQGKPIFITETGTISKNDFYVPAFTKMWAEADIVAITPFILFAGDGPFKNFSLLGVNHLPQKPYWDILELGKIKGSPLLANVSISIPQPYSQPAEPAANSIRQNISNFLDKLINFRTHENTIKIKDTVVTVQVADSNITRMQGLSGKPRLKDDEGMLFKFDRAEVYPFWMKDMNFALDFLWIKEGVVVQINENVLPPNETDNKPLIVSPKEPIDSVLEINAGFVSTHGIQVGDTVN